MRPKQFRRAFGIALSVAAALALMAPAAQAATPAPGYEQFAGCPSPEENPSVEVCVRSVVKSGNFKMGNKNVPITKPITVSGGANGFLENFTANSKGGMSASKQLVPGGVIGLTGLDWLVNFLNIEALQLYAVTELAGQPKFNSLQSVTLPIKVHLINPVLGSKCYVGSTTSPIVLNLTTGTTSPPPPNTPITGVEGTLSFDEKEILHQTGATFVDNSFAAPGANGCTLTLFGFIPISINGLVNTQSGLPAPAGTNETKQQIDTELVGSFNVYP
jgi:hypothetical protein